MRRLLAAAAMTACLVTLPNSPAAADDQRMQLDCGGEIGLIERTNGASWWGVDDDVVYTTKHLRIVHAEGSYEKSYGHVTGDVVVCDAAHVTPDHASRWTVELVRSR